MEKAVVEKKIKEITDKIVREYNPEKIILFGSWAWGTPNEDSDFDLLVIKNSTKPRLERQRELDALLSRCGVAIDILVYTQEELQKSVTENGNLFIEDIVRNGKVLYMKPDGAFAVALPQRLLKVLH